MIETASASTMRLALQTEIEAHNETREKLATAERMVERLKFFLKRDGSTINGNNCPVCGRSFKAVGPHIARHHPEYFPATVEA